MLHWARIQSNKNKVSEKPVTVSFTYKQYIQQNQVSLNNAKKNYYLPQTNTFISILFLKKHTLEKLVLLFEHRVSKIQKHLIPFLHSLV